MATRSTKKSKKSTAKKTARKPAAKSAKTTKKPAPKSTKKRVKKGLLLTLLAVAVLIIAVIAFTLLNLNFIVKTAIEKGGSMAAQTKVRVEGVQISLKDGSGSIKGLTVANPEGFETAHAFSLSEIEVDIDLKSLTGDEIGIDNIVVQAPEIFVEINTDNKNNLNELRKNLVSTEKKPAQTSSPAPGKESRETILYIRHLLFSKGRIDAKMIPMNKDYQLSMPSVEMWNLRGTPQQIAFQVINRLTGSALAEVKKKGIGQATDQIEDKAKSLLKSKKLTL